MGSLSGLESRQRLDFQDTPPELASPGASSYSSRSSPSTEKAWLQRNSTSLPMSNYEKSSGADQSKATSSSETGKDRSESSKELTSRQQLPSLHSLFGPPSSIRPLHSPAERESSFVNSPLDRPKLSPAVATSNSNSYFPQTASPPVSQHRSTHDSRYDGDRQRFNSLSGSLSGLRSPNYYDQHRARSNSRAEPEPNHWSGYSSAKQHEYSRGGREVSFRSQEENARPQYATAKDSPRHYSDQRSTQVGTNGPSTPDGSAVSDGLPSKDGLGPKIWTGTHFLPRFVKAAEVPGEGMCYFYDDGSHCKTVIDGEVVNAHWGVTKAGKPRKRLAIACITCREKKIKCDPDYPRCVQCEKFGRICKFKNAPRGGHNTSPSTPPAELDDRHEMGLPTRQNELRHNASDSGSPVSPRLVLHQPSPETGYSKRLKLGPDAYVANGERSPSLNQPMDHSKLPHALPRTVTEMPRIPDDVLHRAWRTDPYVSDPQSISTVLSQFFGQIDNTMVVRFLPEDLVKSWVASSAHRKSPDDLMLLYSILAVGVTLSGGPKHIAFEYAQVSYYAQKSSTVLSLALVQSRILLALYYVTTSRFWEANELISAATATASCLQLNQEIERSKEANLTVYPYGMTRTGYSESRRRTLWSLFMLERLSPLFPDRATMIHAEDVYIRLPSDSESFERQVDANMPMFNPYESNFSMTSERQADITSQFVEMVHVWSACQSTIHRLASRPNASDAEGFKIRSLTKWIRDWQASLSPRQTFSGSNLESAAFSGKAGSFLSMHLLCHHAQIQLNRYHVSVGKLSSEYRSSHLAECRDNANSIIEIAGCLDRVLRVRPTILSTPPPTLSTAIATAVDVLTASGPVDALNDSIDTMRVAKTAVDGSTNVWEYSRHSQMSLDHRMQKLCRIREQGPRPSSVNGCRVSNGGDDSQPLRWYMTEPLDQTYPIDMDVVYCTSN